MSERHPFWDLKLFVGTGFTAETARKNLTAICEEFIPGHYQIEVINIHEHPEAAADERIIAVPTLIRKTPSPVRKIIGDLRNREMVIGALNLPH